MINKFYPFPTIDSLNDLIDTLASTSGYSGLTDYSLNEDKSISFHVDLPGVKQQDLSVEVNDTLVSISAERKTKNTSRRYTKSFTIPQKYDIQTLQADLEDGVLTVTVYPLTEEKTQVRKVEVNRKS